MRDKIRQAKDYILKADSYDETLWDFFEENGDVFNGDAKDLNKSFLRGCSIYIDNPKEFDSYDSGWIDACGWSIRSLADWICEKEKGENNEN